MLRTSLCGILLTTCLVSSTFANDVMIVNGSAPEVKTMRVEYQLAYRNSLLMPTYLTKKVSVTFKRWGQHKANVWIPGVRGYQYSGIKILKVTVKDPKAHVKTITDDQFPADFGVKRTCSYATSTIYPHGRLILGMSTDHHHQTFTCKSDNHGYIR